MRTSTGLSSPPYLWEKLKDDEDPVQWRAQWQYYEAELAACGYRLEWPEFQDYEDRTKIRTDLPAPANPFMPQPHEAFAICPIKEFAGVTVCMNHPLVRTSTDSLGRFVLIKAVLSLSDECAILRFLRDHRAQHADPADHTIPIVDMIEVGHVTFAVMAQWADAFYKFFTLREFIDFIQQCLEGLNFMHTHLIAHGDIHPENILLNYSGGAPFLGGPVPFRSLFDARYAYIDFGLSVQLPPGSDISQCMVTSEIAGIHTPEHSSNIPHNPFYADIYQLGATFENRLNRDARTTTLAELVDAHAPAIYELIEAMMAEVPEDRVSAAEALQWIIEIRDDIPVDVLEIPVKALSPPDADADTSRSTEGSETPLEHADLHESLNLHFS